jgi:hypothetical protein
MVETLKNAKVAGDKGISETKSKQQSPCINCMHRPVMSWGNACSRIMHKPVRCMYWPLTSQADACIYCMGSKVSGLSRIYLYSSYFGKMQSSWSKGISEMKSKHQSPCSNCMHQPVTSQADACTYCMGSEVSSLHRTYLYSSCFGKM